jgi:hypothetical protein
MDERPLRTPRESYLKALGNLVGVVVALAGIFAAMSLEHSSPPEPKEGSAITPAAVAQVKPLAKVKPKAEPPPVVSPNPIVPEPPKLDHEAIARAESALETARQDRLRADARTADTSQRLADASAQALLDAKLAKTLALRVRDPSTRIDQAAARGGFLKAETEKLKGEIATYVAAPRPKAKVLTNKNPVARPAEHEEQHFEVRHNRVTYIDLDRLISLVKTDADLRIRLAGGARSVESRVGPVGAFSLQYEFRRMLPTRIDDLVDRRSLTYRPSGWEIVPEFEGRGESFEATRRPISEFARTISRFTPGTATITFWVYPDSFELYRKLRDDLQGRGYLVAGRPLPEGMPIRGGPGGSVSAGQ